MDWSLFSHGASDNNINENIIDTNQENIDEFCVDERYKSQLTEKVSILDLTLLMHTFKPKSNY